MPTIQELINKPHEFNTIYQSVFIRLTVTNIEESINGCRVTLKATTYTNTLSDGNWARIAIKLMAGKPGAMQSSSEINIPVTYKRVDEPYDLGEASFWIDYQPLATRDLQIGFKQRSTSIVTYVGDPYSFVRTYTYDQSNSIEPYATKSKPPELSIKDNGNNTFTIKRNPDGKTEQSYDAYDGNHCYATNCVGFYNIDKSSSPTSASGTHDGLFENSTRDWTVDVSKLLPKEGDSFDVKVIGHTIGSIDNSTNHVYYSNASDVVTTKINYYVKPNLDNLKITLSTHNGKAPTPKSVITASWENAEPGNNNSSLKDSKIALVVFINGKPLHIKKSGDTYSMYDCYTLLDGSSTSYDITNLINQCLGKFDNPIKLIRGDVITVGINAYYSCGDTGTQLWYESATSPPKHNASVTLQSNGIMRVKTDNATWREGQAYIKTTDGWKEAIGVYTKTLNGWKESV